MSHPARHHSLLLIGLIVGLLLGISFGLGSSRLWALRFTDTPRPFDVKQMAPPRRDANVQRQQYHDNLRERLERTAEGPRRTRHPRQR